MKQLDADKLEQNITRTVTEDLRANRVGGVEVKVWQDNAPRFEGLFGEKSPGVPLGPGALFRIASMTKPVTAVAFLTEVARGRLRLNDRLADYLPAYGRMQIAKETADGVRIVGESKTEILLWHLLTHVSGIGCDFLGARLFNELPAEKKRTLRTVTDAFAELPLAFEPMTDAKYSATAAFDCCARVIELVSGQSFGDYVRENIFVPLGMTDTTFEPSPAGWERMVSMFDVDADGRPCLGKTVPDCVFGDLPVSYHCAGGGLVSTAADYLRFAQMLLNDGKTPSGEQLLPPEILQLMKQPYTPVRLTGRAESWGLGVRVIIGRRGTLPKGSFGWSGAYGTHFWVDPKNRIAALYMRNGLNSGGAGCETAVQFEKDVMASFV